MHWNNPHNLMTPCTSISPTNIQWIGGPIQSTVSELLCFIANFCSLRIHSIVRHQWANSFSAYRIIWLVLRYFKQNNYESIFSHISVESTYLKYPVSFTVCFVLCVVFLRVDIYSIVFMRLQFDFALWYPNWTTTRNRLQHFICVLLFQVLPAIFIDILLRLFRRRP